MKTFVFLLLTFTAVYSTSAQENIAITVEVEGMLNRNGTMSISVYNSQASYLEDPFTSVKFNLENHEGDTFTISELPQGEYAIAVLHDENRNGSLDFGPMGPVEGYGFSNNPSAMFGPADYNDAKITVAADTALIIELN